VLVAPRLHQSILVAPRLRHSPVRWARIPQGGPVPTDVMLVSKVCTIASSHSSLTALAPHADHAGTLGHRDRHARINTSCWWLPVTSFVQVTQWSPCSSKSDPEAVNYHYYQAAPRRKLAQLTCNSWSLLSLHWHIKRPWTPHTIAYQLSSLIPISPIPVQRNDIVSAHQFCPAIVP
jgi:hypothetical protein